MFAQNCKIKPQQQNRIITSFPNLIRAVDTVPAKQQSISTYETDRNRNVIQCNRRFIVRVPSQRTTNAVRLRSVDRWGGRDRRQFEMSDSETELLLNPISKRSSVGSGASDSFYPSVRTRNPDPYRTRHRKPGSTASAGTMCRGLRRLFG